MMSTDKSCMSCICKLASKLACRGDEGVRYKLWSKVIIVVMVIIMGYSALLPHSFANEVESVAPASANEMTRSMITFFRDDRTDLAVGRVARDEIMVYGVFLSNFFIPWETKVRDMIDSESEGSIPNRVSEKFFGSTGKASQVAELNKKLYDPIIAGLGSSNRDFQLYTEGSTTTGYREVLTGENLLKKMAGVYPDRYLYNASGNPVLDLDNEAVRASFQVLFGMSPEYFFSKGKGLREITSMHMDGLGNIWGEYGNVTFSEYVLILPAALNPIVFTNSLTEVKFPISNVFTMGGILKMEGDFLSNKSDIIPYYDIDAYFPVGDVGSAMYNAENVLNIFGLHSPSKYVGTSNSIYLLDSVEVSQNKIDDFLSKTSTDALDVDDAHVFVGIDISKIPNLTDMVGDSGSGIVAISGIGKDNVGKATRYLFNTSRFSLSEVADDMYYFDNPNAPLHTASDGNEGDWTNDDSLLLGQKMFYKEVYERGSDGTLRSSTDKFQFYSSSYMPSPFSKFLRTYKNASDSSREQLLKERFNSGKDINDKTLTALKLFMEQGTFGDADSGTVKDVFKLLSGGGDKVFDVLKPAESSERYYTIKYGFLEKLGSAFTSIFGLIDSKTKIDTIDSSSFGLTIYDSLVTDMSAAAKDSAGTRFRLWLGDIFDSRKISKQPFETSRSGGNISNYDKSVSSAKKITALYHTFMTYNVFSMNSTFTSRLSGTRAGVTDAFTTPWGGLTPRTAIMHHVNNYPGIYWGYMVQLLKISKDAEGKWTTGRFYNNFLPPMNINILGGSFDLNSLLGTSGVVSSEDRTLEEMQEDIVKKVYGLLSDGPNSYRDRLIKSSQDSWVLSTHRSITGSWVGNVLSVSAGGNSSYASIVGYINTPSLTDLPLTAWLLTDYMYVYLFLLLLILIVLILMTLSNIRTVREALLIFIVMAFILVLPQYLIGNVINISNSVGDKMYSGRFNYWAITQHEQSLSTLRTAAISGNEIDYIIARNMENAKNVYSSDVGVRVKWMSPKKDDLFEQMFNRTSSSQSLTANLTIFRWLFNSYMNQEEYVYDDPLATYLYRPYNAIALAASESYSELIGNVIRREDIAPRLASKRVPGQRDYKFKLVIDPSNSNIDFTPQQQDVIDKVATLYTSPDKAEQEHYRYWIYNSPALMDAIFNTDYETNVGYGGSVTDPYYNAYSLLTESPFYYFYNVLKARYGENSAYTNSNTFKNSLLEKSVFFAEGTDTSADGKLRDFLDLEGLFTYIIPYLQQGNEYVYGWTNIHGTSIDMYEFKDSNIPVDPNSPEYQKYMYEKQKKENLKKVWKLYSPWVDQIYSLDVYSKGVRIADKKVIVEDILNPGAYDEAGRPMIFSEADMRAKNYQVADLTDIERRIQNTLRSTYTDLMYLTNYYDFNDEVLVTAAAMLATFNFNREFSETKLFGESHVLHPQNFELKNFNYDAFMRLLLLNSTGEPLMAEQDLYVRILHKTSIFTGIALIICDFLAVIAIPTMKIAVLLLMLFLSLAVILSCVIAPPDRIFRTIMRAIALPAFLFLVASIVFAFVVSLFLGEGLTGYVGSRTPTLGFTDPTTTLWLMAVVDCVYIYVLWKILKMLLDSFKAHVSSTLFSTLSLAAGVGTAMASNLKSKLNLGIGKGVQQLTSVGTNTSSSTSADEDHKDHTDTKRSSGMSVQKHEYQNESKIDSNKFKSEIDAKASYRKDSSKTSNRNIVKRRTIGSRIVDYKYALREMPENIRDGVVSAAVNTKKAVKHILSRDGLLRDVIDGVTARRLKYMQGMQKHEAERLRARIMKQETMRKDLPYLESRQSKDFAKLEQLEQKIKEKQDKLDIIDSRRNPKPEKTASLDDIRKRLGDSKENKNDK